MFYIVIKITKLDVKNVLTKMRIGNSIRTDGVPTEV